jgi:uncharacterized protein (TIGR02246 family)
LATLVATALGLYGPGVATVRAQAGTATKARQEPKAAVGKDRPEDRAAIRAAMQSFVKAFESGDAKALAASWTAGGEYQREDGKTVRGRDALEKAFSQFFANSPKPKADLEPESIRFLSRDNAIEEGSVSVRRDASEPASPAHYEILFVREDGRWLVASLREQTEDDASPLRDLAWLIGDWKSKDQAADITTTYSWDENKKFIQVRFKIKERDRTLSGFQVLGTDPSSGDLRAWTFEAGGGIGQATWIRDGNHWVAESSGTFADGRTLTSTNILRRINDDTFTWQSINRRLGDGEIADLPPVKVTRLKAK